MDKTTQERILEDANRLYRGRPDSHHPSNYKYIDGYISVQRYVNKEWEALSEDEAKQCEESNNRHSFKIYRAKMHEDHLAWLEKFADWAEKSKGFTIN
jgi:hypothetical protein